MRWVRPATTGEVIAALRAASTDGQDPRLRALVALLSFAGLRLGEARALRWDQVWSLDRGVYKDTIFLEASQAKGGRRRAVPRHRSLSRHLDPLRSLDPLQGSGSLPVLANGDGSPWSHWAASRALRRLLDDHVERGPELAAHSFRKRFGTDIARHRPINEVRVLLGHRELRTTQRYLADPGRELRDAVSVLEDSPEPAPVSP